MRTGDTRIRVIPVAGVSYRLDALQDDAFTVALIPTTLARTTLGHTPIGGPVNLEVDVIAKYVERMLIVPEGDK